MEKRLQLILGFLILGFLFLGISYYYNRLNTGPEYGIKLATVSRETGSVTLIRAGLSQRTKVLKKIDAGNLDSIETSDNSDALLIMESGFQVRLLSNSLVTIERIDEPENYHVVLIIKRGDLHIEQNGRDGELFISKNGSRIAAKLYNDSGLKATPAEVPVDDISTLADNSKSLSEEDISSTIEKHKTSFFKCYTYLLQKQPQAKGEATLTFTIENNGKSSLLEVTTSLGDETFKKCLKEVMSRIEFTAFKGPSISTIFPLNFD